MIVICSSSSLGKLNGDIDCIADNEEKYISFSKKAVVDKYTDENGLKETLLGC